MLKKCWSSGEYPFRSSHDRKFRSLWTAFMIWAWSGLKTQFMIWLWSLVHAYVATVATVWLWLKWVGQLWLIMGGAFRVWLWLKWVGHLWQSKLLFRLEICSKNAGVQESTLSGHHMTTGFGPFELHSWFEREVVSRLSSWFEREAVSRLSSWFEREA